MNQEVATRTNAALYYPESSNSWDYAIQPIPALAALAKSKGITTLIDNSYLRPNWSLSYASTRKRTLSFFRRTTVFRNTNWPKNR